MRRQRSQDDQDGYHDEDEAHVVVPGRSDLRGKHHIFKRNVILINNSDIKLIDLVEGLVVPNLELSLS